MKKLIKIVCFTVFVIYSSVLFAKPNSYISDSAITAQVKASLLKDYTDISVATHNGVVTLTGSVNSNTEEEAVIEKSMSVSGVKDVNTKNLQVRGSNQLVTDTLITAKIKGLLMQKKIVSSDDINPWIKVETTNGIVYLSGEAKSEEQIKQAIRIAKSVKDVKQVDTQQLKVNSTR
jgi:hyperosmotically inducible protein